MNRRRKDTLRVLTEAEVAVLKQIARAQSEPASHVARARALLAVCAGHTYREAARAAGRKSNDAVSHLVVRFNREGLAAIVPRHGVRGTVLQIKLEPLAIPALVLHAGGGNG